MRQKKGSEEGRKEGKKRGGREGERERGETRFQKFATTCGLDLAGGLGEGEGRKVEVGNCSRKEEIPIPNSDSIPL